MATVYNWKDREQESLSSAMAALSLHGVDVTADQLMAAARQGAGRYSNLSLLDACSDLFRALNQPRQEPEPPQ